MSPTPPNDRRPGLKPPQFGLGMLMLVIAAIGGMLALYNAFGALPLLMAILFFLAVAAHVAGNSLGTQLRANGSRPLPDETGAVAPRQIHRPAANQFAPTTTLRQRAPLGVVLVALLAGAGVVAGAVGGGVWFAQTHREQLTLASLLMSGVAFGALGGMWGFLGGGFIYVLAGAIRAAMRDVKQE